MSNHHHTGVIDTEGRLPDFLAHFHKLFAKHQTALRGRWEAFWATEQTSAVELVEADDILGKMVYALANPVKDHIVEKVHHWPGVNALAALVASKPLTATRPRTFFRPDGTLPERVTLTFDRPSALAYLSRAAFVTELQVRVAEVEKQAAADRARTGKRIVGRQAVLKQPWSHSPTTREPRRRLDPRVACKNTWRRIETLRRNKAWLAAYNQARTALVAGLKASFPAGTFWLKRFGRVSCEPAPAG